MSATDSNFNGSGCVFSSTEQLCKTLDEIGVPHEEKWRSLILYMRSAKDHDYLDKYQKTALQSILMEMVKERTFTDEEYLSAIDKSKRIISEPYNKKLQDAIDESEKLLEDFMNLMNRRKQTVSQLGDTTIHEIKSEEDPKAMIVKIRQAFRTVISEMEEDVNRLSLLSLTDPLTGLSNRRSFDEFLNKSLSEAVRDDFALSCIMIDIDKFKKFNDDYGHRIGDQALLAIAKILKSKMAEIESNNRMDCLAARYGGEEFCIVMRRTSLKAAVEFAERLRENIQNYNFIIRDVDGAITQKYVKLSASFGVAELNRDWRGNLPEKMMEATDKALYIAKKSGRNTVCTA